MSRRKTAAALELAAKKSRASRSGVKGEKLIEAYNDVAHAGRVALLRKIPTPTRRVKRGYQWSIIYVARSTVDYSGVLLDGTGRHVALEVKTCTSRPRFYLSEVEPHQRTYLDAVHGAGGVAGLVVVFGRQHDVCVVPWDEARVATKLTAEELARYRVEPEQYLRRFLRHAHDHVSVQTPGLPVLDLPYLTVSTELT